MASTRLGRLSAVARRAAALLAVDARLRTRDRRTLETILRYYAREPSDAPVLFVGCAWYTRRYARLFSDDAYITLDVDPAKARFGARASHRCLARERRHVFREWRTARDHLQRRLRLGIKRERERDSRIRSVRSLSYCRRASGAGLERCGRAPSLSPRRSGGGARFRAFQFPAIRRR